MTDGIDVWGTVFELEHAHHGKIAVVILGTRDIYQVGFNRRFSIFKCQ